MPDNDPMVKEKSQVTIQRGRHNSENPYVMISKSMLQDMKIDPQTKGVLCYLLSLPDNWKTHPRHLAKTLGIGHTAIYNILKKLIRAGYATKSTVKNDRGRFGEVVYYFFEYRISLEDTQEISTSIKEISTVSGNPDTDNPYTVKRTLKEERREDPSDLLHKEEIQKEDTYVRPPPPPQAGEQAAACARDFLSSIRSWKPNFREPNMKRWSKDVARLLKEVGPERFARVIAWLSKEDWWRTRVMCPEKLHLQFDKLEAQMDSSKIDAWYRKNLAFVRDSKAQSGDVLKHIFVRGDWVVNSKNSKELSMKMMPEAFESAFVAMSGIRYA